MTMTEEMTAYVELWKNMNRNVKSFFLPCCSFTPWWSKG